MGKLQGISKKADFFRLHQSELSVQLYPRPHAYEFGSS